MVIELTENNHDELIKTSDLVIIDFWAEWCGPCRNLSPIIDQLSDEYKDKAVVTKCDVDGNQDIAIKYSVRNIPTIIFLKNGEVKDRIVGPAAKSVICDKINSLL